MRYFVARCLMLALGAACLQAQTTDARRLFIDRQANFYAKSPSWDGRFLTEIDWRTGDLAIQELSDGGIRRVTDKGPWSKSGEYAEASAFSPDGKRIVYTWFNQKPRGYELRVINVDGTGMRVLRPVSDAVAYYEPRSWSADGKWIPMTVYRSDHANQIALVSPDDGSMRVLKTVDWRHPLRAALSPDGRFVAYDFPPDEGSPQRDVYILDADGRREARLVSGPDHERFLAWLPDGSGILYYAKRSIYRLPLRDGRPGGAPVLVRADVWNLVPQGMTQRGYVYGVIVSQRQVHTARVDIDAGQVIGAPEPVATDGTSGSEFGAWSANGDRLAYVKEDGFATTLAIQERDGREPREISIPLAQPQGLQWAPDGMSLYLFAHSLRAGEGLYRVQLRTGETELVRRKENIGELNRFELSQDGKGFYVRESRDSSRGSARPMWVSYYDMTGDTPKRLQPTFGQGGRIGVSRDGKWMAYCDCRWGGGALRIMVAPVEGGPERVVYTFPRGHEPIGNRATLLWTPDGRHIVFPESSGSDSTLSGMTFYLRAVPVAGGEVRTLLTRSGEEGPIWNVRLSPDGRRIAYTGGVARSEVWLLSARELTTSAK